MSGFKIIAENILIVLGFALYGILVYYMVTKAIRRYTGRDSRRRSGKQPGRNKAIGDQDTSESRLFFTMFQKKPEESEEGEQARKNFSRDLPTANSYRHRKSQEE